MRKIIAISLIFAVSLLLTACGTQRKVIEQQSQETRVETKYERIFVHDTTFIEIPLQTAEKTVRDSASHLENDYAVSDARITPDGSLFHSLQTKAQKKAVPIEREVERKDSIVYVDNEVIVPVPVEKELTGWQSFKVDYFGWLLAVLFALLAYIFRKPIIRLVRRFI